MMAGEETKARRTPWAPGVGSIPKVKDGRASQTGEDPSNSLSFFFSAFLTFPLASKSQHTEAGKSRADLVRS